jgi:hypothetical protein
VEDVFLYTPPRVQTIITMKQEEIRKYAENSLPISRDRKINPFLPRIFHHKARIRIQER